MIAVDTNIVVHAHRADSPDHEPAVAAIEDLAASRAPWGLPWPVAHEFLKVMTGMPHDPAPLDVALRMLGRLVDAAGCVPLAEGGAHLERLAALATAGRAAGVLVYDARIAAICLDHGVTELWTADRDFSRFPALTTRNPLVSPA